MLVRDVTAGTAGRVRTDAEFQKFVDTVRLGFRVEFCGILLSGKDGWSLRAASGRTALCPAVGSALLDLAIATEDPLVIADTAHDPRVRGTADDVSFFGTWPVMAATGERLGLFVFAHDEPRDFSVAELDHIQGITSAIVHTLEAEQELGYAAAVQRALLPRNRAPLAGYDVAGCCVPTAAVGGDFYDWYPIDGGLAVTLGDVMGKGVGAGIIAARVGAVLKTAARKANVTTAVDRAAETLSDELSDADSFFTLFHARITSATGVVSYVDAGHGLSLIIAADGSSIRLAGTDFPVGLTTSHSWTRHRARLSPGDMLVAVSDGVLDLYDGTLRSLDRITSLARGAASAEDFVGRIEDLAWSASAPDDVTAIAILRK